MATFGQRFKQLRQEKNLVQEKLAEKFFLNKSSISRYERDKQVPELEQLQKFAEFFDVSVDYLLGNTDIRKIEPSKRQDYHSSELIDLLPEEYRELFQEQNLGYIKFAKEMMKEEIDPEDLIQLIRVAQNFKKEIDEKNIDKK